MLKEIEQLRASVEGLHQERQNQAAMSYTAVQRPLKPLEIMVNLLEMAGYFEGGHLTQEGRRVVGKVVRSARAKRHNHKAQKVQP